MRMFKRARGLTILVALAIVLAVPELQSAASHSSAGPPSGRVAVAAELVVVDGLASARLNPVRAARVLGYVSVGMARAASDHPSSELAVAAAAARVIAGMLSTQADAADALVAETRGDLLARGVGQRRLEAAEQRGARIGGRLLDRAARDGADSVQASPAPQFPGAWQPTPPGFLPPVEPAAGSWRTWHLR
ncbi:MAG: hypothetical protein ACRDV2_13505, partial [Actinomycetes bacterium]